MAIAAKGGMLAARLPWKKTPDQAKEKEINNACQ